MINWDLDYKPIDFHTHMGQEYCLYYPKHDADGMVEAMDNCGVDFVGTVILAGVDGDEFADIPCGYGDFKRMFPQLWEV